MSRSCSSQAHAAASFGWLCASAAGLLGVSALGIALGLRSLLVSTEAARQAVACCGTIFSSCLLSPSLLRATVPWLGLGLLLYGLLRGIRNVWQTVRANRRFLAGLEPGSPAPGSVLHRVAEETGQLPWVRRIDLPGRRQAFTAGLRTPRIYVTRDLCAALSPEELAAVLLHEGHHRRHKDPVRVLVILFLQDLLFFLPVGHVLGRVFFQAQEDAADDAVAARGGDRLELASALCRVARLEVSKPPSGSLVRITGRGAIQRRVERLLSPHREDFPRAGLASLAGSALAGTLLVASLYLPVLMDGSPFEFRGCSVEACRGMECVER